MKEYNIVVVGSRAVGKANLTALFVRGISKDDYDPVVEDIWRKQIEVDGEQCILDITTLSGNIEFRAMRDLYMKKGQGFVLVYSITAESTFDELQDLRQEIFRLKETDSDNVPMILVGNKCDLDGERVVEKEQGLSLAHSFGCNFLETSVKRKINVDDIFHDLAKQMIKIKLDHVKELEQGPPKKKGCCTLL